MENLPTRMTTVEDVVSSENMQQAWQRVKANKGAPGIDDTSITDYPEYARANWPRIKSSLLDGSYDPAPVKRVEIPKDSGGTRPLGIPTVSDRVIQQAITQVLVPVFDPHFSESSYGYRPGRSAHQAVKKVVELINQGYRYAVDIDLAKFFDNVNWDVLMNRVGRRVKDKGILRLIGKYLRAGVVVNGRLHQTSKGVPQGGPLSPLLSNILLDDLDKELEKRGHQFCRYADDLIILVKSRRAGERVMQSITSFLEKNLKVQVNRDKSKVGTAESSIFLSFTFHLKRHTISRKAFVNFKNELKRLTGRSWGVSMKYRYDKIRTYLQGWMHYFGIGMRYNDAVELDQRLRRRIRMCYWKQWRRTRKRVGELMKLGVGERPAVTAGLSRKSYWHLAKTEAINVGLSNAYLKEQGLTSIRTLWIKIHHPATAR
jgi:RNA-directed DNA polymerase